MATAAALTVALRVKTALFDRAMKRSGKRVNLFSQTLHRANKLMGAFGVGLGVYAITRTVTSATGSFMQFQKQLALVHTMLDEGSSRLLPVYAKGVQRMSVELAQSTDVLNKGLYDILSAGIAAERGLGVLRTASKAAIGGATDTSVAVRGIVSLLNAYKMEAFQAASVSDLMFATIRRGVLTYEQLAENIGKIAPLARAANMEMGVMLAGISTMTRQGLSVEESVTRLNAVLKNFPHAGADLLAFMEKFKGKDLTAILKTVPNIRAAGGIAALSGDLEGLKRDIAGMNAASGEAEKAFKKMSGTMDFEIQQVRNEMKGWFRDLGEIAGMLAVIAKYKLTDTGAEGKLARITELRDRLTDAHLGLIKLSEATPKGTEELLAHHERELLLLREVQSAETQLDKLGGRRRANIVAGIKVAIKFQSDLVASYKRMLGLQTKWNVAAEKQLNLQSKLAKAQSAKDAKGRTQGREQVSSMIVRLNDEMLRLNGYTERQLELRRLMGNSYISMDQVKRVAKLVTEVKKLEKSKLLKDFAKGVEQAMKNSSKLLGEYIAKIMQAVDAGVLSGGAAAAAIEKKKKELMGTSAGRGEFRTVNTRYMDIRGMQGQQDPTRSRDEKRNQLLAVMVQIAKRQLEKEALG